MDARTRGELMAQSAVELHRRSEGAGRVPPHNLEAEESLLGAMLLSRDAIATAVEGVKAEDFYKPAHAHVFDAILALYSSGEPVDPVTVSEELRRAGLLDAIGGKATILQIQAATPASANAGHYAKIVEELALLRRLIGVAGEIAEMGYELPDDVTSTLDRAEAMVFEVAERRVTDSLVNVHDVLQQALDQLEALYGRDVSITGLPTGFADLDDLLLGLQPSALVVIAARPAMGKCVAWDTPIVDPRTGDLRTAAEVHRRGEVGADVEVFSLDDDLRLATAVPSDFVDDGIKPVFRVRTRLGREVRTTATHPFLTLDGWEPLERLRPGDRIAVPREIPVFGNDVLPDEEVCLLAYLIGDGCVRRSSPLLSTASPLVLDDARRCAEAMGATVRHAGGYDYRFATERGRPNPVLDLVRRHGLAGKGAHDKRIPRAIFRLARRQVARFLNRLFATDGTAYVASPGFAEISYSTVSRRLALDVQHLLLRFGINARLRERSVAYGDTRRTAYEVILRDAGSLQAFAAEIGIFGKEEAVAAVSENAAAKRSQPSNLDTLPRATWELVDEIRADGEWSWADVSRAAGRPSNHNWHAGRRSPRRATVGALAEAMRSTDLALLATSAIWWDEIVSIEYDGLDQVYDLTVPRDHNFVAGDVFVHNTSLALGAALHVAVSEQRPALVFSLEMGHLELTQRLLAAEARVDSKKLRTGRMQDADWTRIAHAVGRLGEAPLFIDDNPHCSVMEMRAKARRIKARQGDLGLIVVDYLQLMSSPHSRAESRQVEVSELSRGLKILAREMETPVLALSQLNRSPEYRQDKRPMLADLRESGCLTADTTITRADTGETVTLGELLARGERNIPVWTVDDDLRVVEGVMTHVFASGVKPVYRLRLRSGLEVKASPNHPFLTFDGWRRLDQLERGERLAVPRRVPEPARPARWRQSEVTVLAHLLGAGDLDPDRPIRAH
ncbi:MAG TPA: replicative DNA helicase, partial [Acidimicrobiia bacterium]|nr:replicative DNA helicase [Acidimicrobiia bacterium]